jgi:hypothetical protein
LIFIEKSYTITTIVMQKWRKIIFIIVVGVLPIVSGSVANATVYSSTHYQVNQVLFGSGGCLSTVCSSSNYSAQIAVGEVGVGNTKGNAYQAYSGFDTNDQPYLQFIVTSSSTSLGTLSTTSVATATGTFSVRDYLSQGYIVETDSPPPSSGYHTLTALSTASLSAPGTEQFGMNLVANTSPAVGTGPVQFPSSVFSFGTVTAGAPGPNGTSVATGYSTPNYFKYNSGDVIAASNQSSGQTNYTISYITNISSTTPGGAYTFNQVLIALPTY